MELYVDAINEVVLFSGPLFSMGYSSDFKFDNVYKNKLSQDIWITYLKAEIEWNSPLSLRVFKTPWIKGGIFHKWDTFISPLWLLDHEYKSWDKWKYFYGELCIGPMLMSYTRPHDEEQSAQMWNYNRPINKYYRNWQLMAFAEAAKSSISDSLFGHWLLTADWSHAMALESNCCTKFYCHLVFKTEHR